MTMKEFALKFHQLSHYSPELMSSMRARMRMFSFDLPWDLVLEYKFALLNSDINISRIMVYIQ